MENSSTSENIKNLQIPLDKDLFLRSLIRELAGNIGRGCRTEGGFRIYQCGRSKHR